MRCGVAYDVKHGRVVSEVGIRDLDDMSGVVWVVVGSICRSICS